MERYYEKLDKELEDMQAVLESIAYESELIMEFGPAMEADATVASTGSGGSTGTDTSKPADSSGDSSGSKAADTINNAGDNLNDTTDPKKEAEKAKDQTNNKADSKAREGLMNNIKEVLNAIMEFINKHLTDYRASISTMLSDSNKTVEELNNVMRGKKPNLDLTIRDYRYNDGFITEYAKALDDSFLKYGNQIQMMKGVIQRLKTAIEDGTDEEKDAKIKEIMHMVKNENNDGQHLEITSTTVDSDTRIIRAHVLIAKQLNIENAESKNVKEIKQFIYNKYKGVSSNNSEVPIIQLSQDHLNKAINFLKNYKNYLQMLNNIADRIKTNATVYKDICEDGKNLKIVDNEIAATYNLVLNNLASDLSTFVNFSDYLLTIMKERAIAAEVLVRRAYGAQPRKETDTNTSNDNNRGADIRENILQANSTTSKKQAPKNEKPKQKPARRSSRMLNGGMPVNDNDYN